jgi:hypothetical protein
MSSGSRDNLPDQADDPFCSKTSTPERIACACRALDGYHSVTMGGIIPLYPGGFVGIRINLAVPIGFKSQSTTLFDIFYSMDDTLSPHPL